MKKITVEYESIQEFEADQDWIKKGLVLEDLQNHIRSEIKYGDLDSLTLQVYENIRNKIIELEQE